MSSSDLTVLAAALDGRGRQRAAAAATLSDLPAGPPAPCAGTPRPRAAAALLRACAWTALLGVLAAAGCAGPGAGARAHQPRSWTVKAHQREVLADRIMRLDGDPQEVAADEHVLSNREGAMGGNGTSGGGCGCN